MIGRLRLFVILLGLASSAAPAHAEDAVGEWTRENGLARIRIAPCGDGLRGDIVWLKIATGPAKLGQRVFYGMKPQGDQVWKGNAFNPEDGKTYSGEMRLSGGMLTTAGCALGGLICKSARWNRFK
jgi:uncharacterized protein (DUF2147 family)